MPQELTAIEEAGRSGIFCESAVRRKVCFWITGRTKDLIIRGSHNIDPGAIEEVFFQHPGVALVAVVGEPDAHAGELPMAFVQPRPGTALDAAELIAFVRERTPERAAVPVQIYFIDAIPLTAVGKGQLVSGSTSRQGREWSFEARQPAPRLRWQVRKAQRSSTYRPAKGRFRSRLSLAARPERRQPVFLPRARRSAYSAAQPARGRAWLVFEGRAPASRSRIGRSRRNQGGSWRRSRAGGAS
jgi:hypothetical protein